MKRFIAAMAAWGWASAEASGFFSCKCVARIVQASLGKPSEKVTLVVDLLETQPLKSSTGSFGCTALGKRQTIQVLLNGKLKPIKGDKISLVYLYSQEMGPHGPVSSETWTIDSTE
jgi:hypothetical protein